MINYSLFQADFIFAEWDDFNPQYKQIELDSGKSALVERVNEEEVRLIQLISTDPQDFLQPQYNPGNIIKSGLQLK